MSIGDNFSNRGFRDRLARLTRLRLIVPMLRSRNPPEYIAKGVAVGLAVAFTPTVGVQLVAVMALWTLSRFLSERFQFHLIAAMAWVWVTNILTIGPIYYVFLLTGQLMLGRFEQAGSLGLHEFSSRLTATIEIEAGLIENLWLGTVALFNVWGLPLFVGSLPWSILAAWLGYVWSSRFLTHLRRRRRQRAEANSGPENNP